MKIFLSSGSGALAAALLTALLSPGAAGQDAPAKEIHEAQRTPPRAAPTDYQAHAKVGAFTVAAEFRGHSVPTPEALLSSEDYVVVEVGLYGPPDAHLTLSYQDFSIRINEKKTAPAQPFTMVFKSLKDPDWEPPAQAAKSKTSIGSGGGGQSDLGSTPAVVHIPIALERTMELRVQKASLPEGDRPLPEAGLIFFQHHGKVTGIHSLELTYSGPAGKATLTLEP
jgi:hypothetical protein